MRLVILILSMASVGSFGYALAGYGVKFFGVGEINWLYMIGGLVSGFSCAATALFLWKRWLEKNCE